MLFQIDQSGKIEHTNKDTVMGMSNGKTRTVKIAARNKRLLQERCRIRDQGRVYMYRSFAALIFLLIKEDLNLITDLIIDVEYPGQNKVIKDILLEFLRTEKLNEPEITFLRIGSTPAVHYVAYDVFCGRKSPDKIVTLEEISNLVILRRRH